MNTPSYNLVPILPSDLQEDKKVDYLGLLDTVVNSRWRILSVTLITLLVGAAYAFLSPPVYRADTLIQVEQNQKSPDNNVLGSLSAIFNDQSSTAAEIEILQSRLVIGRAVDNLQLYVSAHPNYVPIVGAWLAKHATGLSNPHFLGFGGYLGGYVWGTESIQMGQLDIPPALEDTELTLTATENGYELTDADGRKLTDGKVGEVSNFTVQDGSGSVLVNRLNARPGAKFILTRHSRQDMIKNLQSGLTIAEKGKPSGVLSMTLEGTSPTTIARILNAIGSAYVQQNTDRKAAVAEKSLTFLDNFLPQLKKQMDESGDKYTEFRDKHGTFDLGTEGKLSLDTSVRMQTQLFELQQKRRELTAQYGPSHPSVVAANRQIAALEQEVAKLSSHIKTLPDLEQRLLNLSRDVKVNGELYASLLNNRQQLLLIKEGKVGSVRLVDTAVAPTKPIKPQRALVLTIAGALGLILGTALALFRNTLRPGIKAANEIETTLGLSVFSTVPRVLPRAQPPLRLRGRTGGKYILAETSPNDPAIESLRSLRTAMKHALQEASNNIVLLTGPTPNVGKTFTSVNLAAVLGAADKKVLLIDADFRSGRLHQYFELDRNAGLSDLIQDVLSLEDVLHKGVMRNVDLITTGKLPHNPAEMLLSHSALELLQSLSAQYDIVLLDTAPVLAVSDALALAPHVGTVFMLARAQISTLSELEEAAKRLRQAGAQVSGVIFNDFDATTHRLSVKYGNYHHSHSAYGGPTNYRLEP